MSQIEAGVYRHYKGRQYQVLGVARHSENEEEMVVYRQLYGDFTLWVRPAAIFGAEVTVAGETVPRFQWIGRRRRPRMLSTQALARARAFLTDHARPLERARAEHLFDGGSAEPVLDELRRYQNSDGGFGHGLEPDLQTPDSSVLATTVALQLLGTLQLDESHPLIRGAMTYLRSTYSEEFDTWPIIPETVDNAPHAPWWQPRAMDPAQAARQFINPRAEVIGYLFTYASYSTPEFRTRLLKSQLDHLNEQSDAIEMHELLCLLRLLRAPMLPDGPRQTLAETLTRVVSATVSTEPGEWRGYGLRPADVVDGPDSPFVPLLGDATALDLDARIEAQGADGAWSPPWNWGDLHPEAWARARTEWSGVLTLNTLAALQQFGRLPEKPG